MPELADLAPTYRSANRNFNEGDPTGAVVLSRVVFEKLLRAATAAPEGEKLELVIKRFVDSEELMRKPTQRIGEAVRLGGNAAAHADESPNLSDAEQILDLIDFFVSIFYLAPAQAAVLIRRLQEARSGRKAKSNTGVTSTS